MVNTMEEFEKDRKKEMKFYALINFFKLIILSKLCQENYDMFCLMEGSQKLEQLIRDMQEENISLRDHSLISLYIEMGILAEYMEKVSEIPVIVQAKKEFQHICKIKNLVIGESACVDDVGADLDLVSVLPIEVIAIPEIRESLLSTKKQKTLGERK